MAFDAIIPSVASGKCDFAMAGMTVNPERAASVDFTDTYASSSLVILVKADNTEITGEDILAGHVVGASLEPPAIPQPLTSAATVRVGAL